MLKPLQFFVLLILITNGLYGQERVFKFFSIKDGLPSNNIFKIRFDKKGFLWIAHDKGISRFDGNTFKNYNNPRQKSNVYTDLHIGPDGKVWMTNLGLQVFYIENDEMKLFRSFDLKYTPSTLHIAFLSNGNMVFNAQGGLTEVDPSNGREYVSSMKGPIQSFYQINDDIYFINPQSASFCVYRNRHIDSAGYKVTYPPLFVNSSVILSTHNSINRLMVTGRDSGNALKPIELGFNYNYSEIIDNRLIVFTNGNIHSIDLNQNPLQSRILLEGHSFTHYTKDALGNEWFSTLNEGIMFLPAGNCRKLGDNDDILFLKLSQFRENAYCITQDNQLYKLEKNIMVKIGDYDNYFNGKPIILMKNLQDKKLVIGHSKFLTLNRDHEMKPYFQELALKDICLDNGKNVYMATSGSVYSHPFDQTSFNKINDNPDWFTLLGFMKKFPMEGRFNCVAYDTISSMLYIGGVPGFFVVSENDRIVELKDNGLSIYSTIVDYHNPYMIVGTIQSGIYILKNGYIVGHYNASNSTMGNTIIKIKHYGKYIWVLSEKGIHNLDLYRKRVQSYANVGAVNLKNCTDFTIAEDQLYLISSQSLYSINLQEFIKSISPVPVFFNSVKTGETTLFNLKDLHFRHNNNNLSISLEIPAAKVLGNAEFEYNLNNSQWFLLSKGLSDIFLNQLSPGTYKLNVRQKGMDNVYSMSFVIEPPYWTSWWFYLLILMSLGLIVLFTYRNRIKIIREKSSAEIEKFKLEKALQQNILSSIKAQMNPHFLFNALNTIQSYIYLNDKKLAIAYLGKFSVLTRKILEQSNHETISLSEEHETLDLYLQLEKMRFEKTLEYTFTFEKIPFKDQFRVPPMLIQPYVENAVKHGLMHKSGPRKLDIRFNYNKSLNVIEVYIEDNGIGRKKAREINEKRHTNHRSFSSEANKTRLEILNSENRNHISVLITDKTDEYGNSKGTLVQINIPVL